MKQKPNIQTGALRKKKQVQESIDLRKNTLTHIKIFEMKINAIDQCAYFGVQRNYTKQSIVILSKSQARLKAFNSNLVAYELTRKRLNKVNTFSLYNNICIR